MSDASRSIPDKRVQFFTGKGGVGKSTLVAAAALRLAALGRRVVIVELGDRSAIGPMFDVDGVGHHLQSIAPNVELTRVEFEPALAGYMASRLRLKPLGHAVARNQSLRRFFVAAPGVAEIVALHRITELSAPEAGFDHVLIDLESTGHALMFFDLPAVFDAFLRDGPLRSVLDKAIALLRDPAQTCVNLVAIPEELPSIETKALYANLRERRGLHLGVLVINQVPQTPLTTEERTEVDALLNSPDTAPALAADARLAVAVCEASERAERVAQDLVTSVSMPFHHIERSRSTGRELVERVAEGLA